MMFNTHYELTFKDNDKGLTEVDVAITDTFFWWKSTKKVTMIFIGSSWVNKNSMECIKDSSLIEIATNWAIYHATKEVQNTSKKESK